jgi:hypothetical protein
MLKKNQIITAERGVNFEQMTIAIEDGGILDILQHPNVEKYPNQKIFVVEFNDYVYMIPFVEEDDCYFLKTVIPSRKATRDYLKKGD